MIIFETSISISVCKNLQPKREIFHNLQVFLRLAFSHIDDIYMCSLNFYGICNWLSANRNQFDNKFHLTPLIFAVKLMLSPTTYKQTKLSHLKPNKSRLYVIQLQSEMLATHSLPHGFLSRSMLLINFSYLSFMMCEFHMLQYKYIQTYYGTFTALANSLSQFLLLNRSPNPAITQR